MTLCVVIMTDAYCFCFVLSTLKADVNGQDARKDTCADVKCSR